MKIKKKQKNKKIDFASSKRAPLPNGTKMCTLYALTLYILESDHTVYSVLFSNQSKMVWISLDRKLISLIFFLVSLIIQNEPIADEMIEFEKWCFFNRTLNRFVLLSFVFYFHHLRFHRFKYQTVDDLLFSPSLNETNKHFYLKVNKESERWREMFKKTDRNAYTNTLYT